MNRFIAVTVAVAVGLSALFLACCSSSASGSYESDSNSNAGWAKDNAAPGGNSNANSNPAPAAMKNVPAGWEKDGPAPATDNVPANAVALNNKTCCITGLGCTEDNFYFFNGYKIGKCCAKCHETFNTDVNKYADMLQKETGVDVRKAPANSAWTRENK